MDTTPHDSLAALDAFVCRFSRRGRTPREFWAEFDLRAIPIEAVIAQSELPSVLEERLLEIRSLAADLGYQVPPEDLDQVM